MIALLALSGMGMPVQDALNAQLRTAIKSPMLGALISFVVGAVALGVLTAFGVIGIPKVSAGVVIDHFGWLGVPRVLLNPWRIAGAVGLFVSVLLMQKK